MMDDKQAQEAKEEAFGDKKKREKPFEQWSKREKRTATIKVDGKTVPVLQALNKTVKMLDASFTSTDNNTGQKADHYVILTKLYYAKGMPGVAEYLDKFSNLVEGVPNEVKITA